MAASLSRSQRHSVNMALKIVEPRVRPRTGAGEWLFWLVFGSMVTPQILFEPEASIASAACESWRCMGRLKVVTEPRFV